MPGATPNGRSTIFSTNGPSTGLCSTAAPSSTASRDAGRDRCLGEEAAGPGACRRNGEQPIVRFIGQTNADANPPYWKKWVDTVVRWLDQGRRPIVFLHTPDNLVSPELCRRFHAEVADQSDEPNLPSAPPVSTQDGLELG